jgi:AraC-like DNA-binding protein/ligand-binding sensor protein
MITQEFETAEDRAFQKLIESPFLRTWRKAFLLATGLETELIPAEGCNAALTPDTRTANPFCRSLQKAEACRSCTAMRQTLWTEAAEKATSAKCFAGLREAAVPVRIGDHPVAYLVVGQVFDRVPVASDFEVVADRLRAEGLNREDLAELQAAYVAAPVMDTERFHAATTLLAAFSIQLAGELNRLLMAEENAESPAIARAKQYINAHLDERISLDEVAAHVCVSPFYFCKIFKQATGMTLTEYINRRRVEWAKRKLLNPHARVTEVAFDVGYQSLSQFNRSFLRYAGESPTKFREQAHTEQICEAA